MAQIAGPYNFQSYYQTVKPIGPKRVWWSLVKSKNIFTRLPMVTEEAFFKVGQRVIDNLPTIEAVPLGTEPTDFFYQPSIRFQEESALFRKDFTVDEGFTKIKNVLVDPIKFNSDAYMKSLAISLDNYFFNNLRTGGSIGDAYGWIGIKYRILDKSGPDGTSKYGVNPDCSFASGASLLLSTLSTANAVRLWFDIDQMLQHLDADDGEGVIMLVAPSMLRSIDALAKTATPAGGFEITRDVFQRTIRKYKQMEIASCGVQLPLPGGSQIVPIISVADDPNGYSAGDYQYNPNGNFYTTFYFIKKGSGKGEGGGLTAWQPYEMIQRTERLPSTRQIYWLHDMTAGVFYEDTRAIGGLHGIQCNGPSIN